MTEPTFAERARKLRDSIAQTRQDLRDEHYPYDGDIRVYGALHEVLRQLGDWAESFVKWSEYSGEFSAPDSNAYERFRQAERIFYAIKGELA
jgi:hypothetical protein